MLKSKVETLYLRTADKMMQSEIEQLKKKIFVYETERKNIEAVMKKESPIAYKQMQSDLLLISEQAQIDYKLRLTQKVLVQVDLIPKINNFDMASQTNL